MIRIIAGKWTDAGSKDFLKSYIAEVKSRFLPPLTDAIIQLCQALKVKPSSSTPFLGRGADGYVFRVVSLLDPDTELAMKVVMRDKIAEEFGVLQQAYAVVPDIVVEPVGHCVELMLSDGTVCGAYLMKEVGSKVDMRMRPTVLKLLVTLHGAGLKHGDPRMPNVVKVGEKCKFIDFRLFGVQFSEESRKNDLKILLKSAYLYDFKDIKVHEIFNDDKVFNYINQYGENPTLENANIVIAEILRHVTVT